MDNPEEQAARNAQDFLRVARAHPECRGAVLLGQDGGVCVVELELNVEMALSARADGQSASGVRTLERVRVFIDAAYVWTGPSFVLRDDFPRSFPHLQPDPLTKPPRPCLVQGSQQEFFLQFGLPEVGALRLIDQLGLWLRRAASDELINPIQGWEPVLRRDLRNAIVLDAEYARSCVNRNGGSVVLQASFVRHGPAAATLDGGATVGLFSTTIQTPLRLAEQNPLFSPGEADPSLGTSVVLVAWPDKLPSGQPFVANRYLPESVRSLRDLYARASEVGCRRSLDGFVGNLERCFAGVVRNYPIPIGIVFCARRPMHLIGSASDIELLPYIVELRPVSARRSLFATGADEVVAPAGHYDVLSADLLRRVSGAGERPALALLGCGSLGSKVALHAVRCGHTVVSVADQSFLGPHHLARHGLGPTSLHQNKAVALAGELAGYGAPPLIGTDDLTVALRDRKTARAVIGPGANIVLNTTASIAVREVLDLVAADLKGRAHEAVLFGRGRAAILMSAGSGHNPSILDLFAEFYARNTDARLGALLFDPNEGLSEVQIGQGCGSLTMKMEDARLSVMAAALYEALTHTVERNSPAGTIMVGVAEADSPGCTWTRMSVEPLTVLSIVGADGWTVRISAQVRERLQLARAAFPHMETGGVILGCLNARQRAMTIVDLLDAPDDSVRAESTFVLGTGGLSEAIRSRCGQSGNTLQDLGTWHSHLADSPPSQRDWATARDLARERSSASVLLIITPNMTYAISGHDGRTG